MKLSYYKGDNFGDALNPLIFEKYLPDFFSENSDYEFLGIGSVLGLIHPQPKTKKLVVFSSGFAGGAYGSLPSKQQMENYDFRCVRGPKTAHAVGIPIEKGICDAAILLPEVTPNHSDKKYKFSYMPHHRSMETYPQWAELLESIDIHLIDPRKDVHFVIEELKQTEVLLAEAMHGAIVADAYRIPWIPIKAYRFINAFKWKDYCLSLNMEYQPNRVKSLINKDYLKRALQNRLHPFKSNGLNQFLSDSYNSYQHNYREKDVIKEFERIKNAEQFLSAKHLLDSKKEILLEELEKMRKEYKV